jgi:amidase
MTSSKQVAGLTSPFATASQLAQAVLTRQISATELVELTFQRIDRVNPKINAIVWEFREHAKARARQADEALAKGDAVGALHGVPVTIKESFAYRGSPSTWGLAPLKEAMSPRTAVAIERLESAGAIVVGKTNVPVMLGDWQSDNPVFGTTNNPWDVSRTAGGSSGGSAAAVAAGLGALSVGSDLNGSLRIPAHFCGVYGHKPSLELISTAGFQPGPWDGAPGYPMDLAIVGPMARSAGDLAIALTALAGPNSDEAKAWSWRMPPPRHSRLADFRIGYVFDADAAPLASDVRASCEKVIAELRKAGAAIEQGWPAGFDPRAEMKTFLYLLGAFLAADMNSAQREQARERFAKNADDLFAAAAVEPHARWLHETVRRMKCRAVWQQYFERHDVFLLPTTVTTAFPHDHGEPMHNRTVTTSERTWTYVQAIPYWMMPATLAGLPATVAPIGRTASGLPVGIQIVAPMWEDGTSIEFAARLADMVGGFTPPPAFAD